VRRPVEAQRDLVQVVAGLRGTRVGQREVLGKPIAIALQAAELALRFHQALLNALQLALCRIGLSIAVSPVSGPRVSHSAAATHYARA